MKMIKLLTPIGISVMLFTGCMKDSRQMIIENPQQLEIRSYQTKEYNKSKKDLSRAVISTLQDLSFIIDKADMETGTVTATKLAQNAAMKITIIVREKSKDTMQVRANAQFASAGVMPQAVTEPETYQAFFTALDKSLFLEKEGL